MGRWVGRGLVGGLDVSDIEARAVASDRCDDTIHLTVFDTH